MRTIKFRAWDKEEKIMVRSGHTIDFDGSLSYYKMGCVIPTKNLVLMQFTGLKDKNGVEIYDGDIIKYAHIKTSDIYEVFYFEKDCMYLISPKGNKKEEASSFLRGEFEIIGNIYENSNLLK